MSILAPDPRDDTPKNTAKPLRVLSLDGGGMRGTYMAAYLAALSEGFSKQRGGDALDLGAGFDLIVGTSTGGIIGCALAAGIPLSSILSLYLDSGPQIFKKRLPRRAREVFWDLFRRKALNREGEKNLRSILTTHFKEMTIGEVFKKRQIALAIAAVEMSQHRSWVFKTPHLESSNHRDDDYRLVDVCLATSAAPIYRSLAAINYPGQVSSPGHRVFADGGLWANNPVLVGLCDALEMAKAEQEIQIFCLGTCPLPAGEQIKQKAVHRGLTQWHFGGDVATLSIDAQEFAFDNIARFLTRHLNRKCHIIRFPRKDVPATLMQYLDLDDTRPAASQALISQARSDADITNSRCSDFRDSDGQIISKLFQDIPSVLPSTAPPPPSKPAN